MEGVYSICINVDCVVSNALVNVNSQGAGDSDI